MSISNGSAAKAAFLASSNLQGDTLISTTLIPSSLAFSTDNL